MTRVKRWIPALAVLAAALAAPAASALESWNDATLLPLADASASPRMAMQKPIARIWRGRTLTSKADEYEAYLFATGIPKVRQTPGNLGATVLRRADGKQTEFLVISVWDSIEAIQRFAGKDYQKAVILDRDKEYLIKVEPNVLHYEIERPERKH